MALQGVLQRFLASRHERKVSGKEETLKSGRLENEQKVIAHSLCLEQN